MCIIFRLMPLNITKLCILILQLCIKMIYSKFSVEIFYIRSSEFSVKLSTILHHRVYSLIFAVRLYQKKKKKKKRRKRKIHEIRVRDFIYTLQASRTTPAARLANNREFVNNVIPEDTVSRTSPGTLV